MGLRCMVWGHPDTETEKMSHATVERCVRCGDVVDREYTYEHKAMQALRELCLAPPERFSQPGGSLYTPVKRAERGDLVLKPGDRLLYTRDSAFPGIVGHRQATVKYIYEKPGIKRGAVYTALVDRERNPIPERRWVGRRDGGAGIAPTPGLRAR